MQLENMEGFTPFFTLVLHKPPCKNAYITLMKFILPITLTLLTTLSPCLAVEKEEQPNLSTGQTQLIDTYLNMFQNSNIHHEVKSWEDFHMGTRIQLSQPPESASEVANALEKNATLWKNFKFGKTIEYKGYYITPYMHEEQDEEKFSWNLFIATDIKSGMVYHRFGC